MLQPEGCAPIGVATQLFWLLKPRGIDRGRDEGLTSPLPPNWTGGFPAFSFPVSGFSARLTISTRAVFQTTQPLCRKPSVGPSPAVGFAQPVARSLLPLAQHRPQATPQPPVRTVQARAVAFPDSVPLPPSGRAPPGFPAAVSRSSWAWVSKPGAPPCKRPRRRTSAAFRLQKRASS